MNTSNEIRLQINGLDVKRARHSEVVGLLSRSKPYVQLEVERDPSTDFSDVFESENEPENFTATRRSTLRSSLISNRSETGSTPWKRWYYYSIRQCPRRRRL